MSNGEAEAAFDALIGGFAMRKDMFLYVSLGRLGQWYTDDGNLGWRPSTGRVDLERGDFSDSYDEVPIPDECRR